MKSSSSSSSSLIDNNNKLQNEQTDNNLKRDSTQSDLDDNRNKKKRCSDRYDSSESSDSGVATSLSCTDSSTASSDASDPGSPYSPVSLSDDVQLSKKSINNNNNNQNNNNMPPSQITLLTNNTKNNSPSTANSTAINNKEQQQQQLEQQQKTEQNLWPWHKIQNNNNNNGNNNVQSGTLNSIATAKINPIQQNNNSNKNLNKNKRLSPGNNHNNNDNNNHITANKKSRLNNQNATITSTTITNGGVAIQTDFVQKLTKSTTSINNKRLKLAANLNEECQTKITGFFKSQMKQLSNNSMKKDKNIKLTKSSTTLSPPLNNNNNTHTNSNDFDSLFNNNNQNDGSINLLNQKNQFYSINSTALNTVTTTTSTSSIKNYESTTNSLQNIFNQQQNNSVTNNLSLVQLNNQIGTNLKKNERNKNMKIAQVAPNLRKTTNSSIPPTTTAIINKNNNQLISNSTIGKSPKKHIAIAPRTFDIKPAKAIKPNPPALVPTLQQIQQDHTKITGTTQPTVLLTAIRIPSQTTAQNNYDKNQTISCKSINSLTTSSNITNQQQNCIVSSATNTIVTPTTNVNGNNSGNVAGNLYQIPMMPNLVQFPTNILATNGANLLVNQNGQLARISNATTAAQNFLYGTVIKLQQIAANQSNNNSNNGLVGGSSGLGVNSLINSQNNNGTNGLIQIDNQNIGQGIVPLGNQQQKHINGGLPLIQHQSSNLINQQFNNRLTAQQIIMATSTNGGYLLNATTMPAVFTNTKFIPQTMPALQPIQSSVTQQNSTILPSLTSILQNNQQNLQQTIKSQQKSLKQKSNLDAMYTNLLQQQELTKIGKNYIKQQQSPALLHFKSSTSSSVLSTKQQISKISSLVPPPLVTLASYHEILKTTTTTTGKTLLTRNTSSIIEQPTIIGALPARKLINNNDIPPLTSTKHAKNFNTTPINFNSNEFVKKMTSELNGKTNINEINKVTSTTVTVSIPPLLTQDVKDDIDLSVLPSVPKKLKTLDIIKINNNLISSSLSSSPDVFIDEGVKLDSLSNSSNSSSLSSALAEASSTSSGIITKISSLSQISINNDEDIIKIKAEIQTTIIDKNDRDEEDEKQFVIEQQHSDINKTNEIEQPEQKNQLIKCAISPILSQPKTIRFPASGEISGTKGLKRHDGVCYWDNCNAKHDNSSKLLDHMQTIHVNTQTGPFACLWSGCKVHGKESCSRRWLERHVLSHGGTKQFKCIVDGCGIRFASQLALQKHVNGHFNATETKDNPSKRTSDPPVPKVLRKNGKKIRYRRQPFSARMYDFIDSGMMEGLQHRLKISGTISGGAGDEIIFSGQPIARRTTSLGVKEVFVKWKPNDIIDNEWVPQCPTALTKFIKISNLSPEEKINYDNYLSAANLHSDICTIFNDNKFNLLTAIKNKQFNNNNNIKLSSSSSSFVDDQQNQPETDQYNKFQCNGSIRNCYRQYNILNEKLFRKQSRKPPTQKLLLPS